MYAVEAYDGLHWNQVYSHVEYEECRKAFDQRCKTDPAQRYRMIVVFGYSPNHAEAPKEPEKPLKPVHHKGK